MLFFIMIDCDHKLSCSLLKFFDFAHLPKLIKVHWELTSRWGSWKTAIWFPALLDISGEDGGGYMQHTVCLINPQKYAIAAKTTTILKRSLTASQIVHPSNTTSCLPVFSFNLHCHSTIAQGLNDAVADAVAMKTSPFSMSRTYLIHYHWCFVDVGKILPR